MDVSWWRHRPTRRWHGRPGRGRERRLTDADAAADATVPEADAAADTAPAAPACELPTVDVEAAECGSGDGGVRCTVVTQAAAVRCTVVTQTAAVVVHGGPSPSPSAGGSGR